MAFSWLKMRKAAAAPRAVSAAIPAAAAAVPATSEAKRIEGNGFLGRNDLPAAAACYREAVRLDERSVAARINLAYVLLELKQPAQAEEAEGHLLQAVALDITNFDALYMLGNIAKARADTEGALAHFERVLALKPDFELAWRDACLACVEGGQVDRVEALLQRGLQALPDSGELHFLRGNALQVAGRSAAAIESYEKVLSVRRDHVEAYSNIAVALRSAGRLQEAAAHLQRVAALRPADRAAHMQYGAALLQLGRTDAAIEAFRRAVAADPKSAHALSSLGSAYAAQKRSAEAIEQYQRALAIDATHAFAYAGLGVEYNEQGRPREAMESLRKAIELDPAAAEAHSSLLFLMSFLSPAAEYLEEARRYGQKVTERAKPVPASAPARGAAAKPPPLRVGVVSGDLRAHPVALFIEGALAHIDRRSVELHAYTTTVKEDEVTKRLRPLFSGWRCLAGLDDEAAARLIRADDMHVLIDLAGHTADNRLSMFPWRPAPVQVTWLGYLASTGLSSMDYVLADRISLPEQARGQFAEKVCYLPNSLYCYTAPAEAPPVAALPALALGTVTFGSFQRMNKVSDETLQAWAEVLRRLPGARLRVQNKQMADARARARLIARLKELGVAAERVDLAGQIQDRTAYLACHEQVDIVLDTFPYPGITTTCEALWMGVPTVCLAGDTLLSRQGASLLHCVGLDDWVATDVADFVSRAVRHAGDIDALAALRAGLRARAEASPLFDAPRFARDLERALHGLWEHRWERGAADAVAAPV